MYIYVYNILKKCLIIFSEILGIYIKGTPSWFIHIYKLCMSSTKMSIYIYIYIYIYQK